MGTLNLRRWDSAAYLKTDEDMVEYLEACLEEAGDDAAFIAKALGNVARARGMTQLSVKSREIVDPFFEQIRVGGLPVFQGLNG